MATAPDHRHPNSNPAPPRTPEPHPSTPRPSVPPHTSHSSHPSHSPDDPTIDHLTQTLDQAWQSAHNAQQLTTLTRRLAQIEPLVDTLEHLEPRIQQLARDRRQYSAREVIDHVDNVTRLANRCAALRKTLLQILHHPVPGSAGVPPASSDAPSDCTTTTLANPQTVTSSKPCLPSEEDRCSAGAPAGHSNNQTHPTPTTNAAPAPASAPSSSHNSSLLIHNSPQRGAPIPPIPPLPIHHPAPAPNRLPYTDPDPNNQTIPLHFPTANGPRDHLRALATVRTLQTIGTIPLKKLKATLDKLQSDLNKLEHSQNPNQPPNPPATHSSDPSDPSYPSHLPSTQHLAPSTHSARITHTPNTIPHTTIDTLDAPNPPPPP